MSLFTPVWKTDNWEKAFEYIRKCKKDKELVRIAEEAPLKNVRVCAISHIKDEELARTEVMKIHEPEMLLDIIRAGANDGGKFAALVQLENPRHISTAWEWIRDTQKQRSFLSQYPDPEKRAKAAAILFKKYPGQVKEEDLQMVKNDAETLKYIACRNEWMEKAVVDLLSDPADVRDLFLQLSGYHGERMLKRISDPEKKKQAACGLALNCPSCIRPENIEWIREEPEALISVAADSAMKEAVNEIREPENLQKLMDRIEKGKDPLALYRRIIRNENNPQAQMLAQEALNLRTEKRKDPLRDTVLDSNANMNDRRDALLELLDMKIPIEEDEAVIRAVNEMTGSGITVVRELAKRKSPLALPYLTGHADRYWWCTELLADYPTKESVEALYRALQSVNDTGRAQADTNRIAQAAACSLKKIYTSEAADDAAKAAVESIPRQRYGKHVDVGDHGRSCHTDENAAYWDPD